MIGKVTITTFMIEMFYLFPNPYQQQHQQKQQQQRQKNRHAKAGRVW